MIEFILKKKPHFTNGASLFGTGDWTIEVACVPVANIVVVDLQILF